MKRLSFFVLLSAISLWTAAQTIERVYVSTDRNCYVAGDNLFVSAFCIDAATADGKLSSQSKIAYIELQNATGTVQTMKVALDEGRGCGCMSLYPDLPTGNYALIAYTSQNKAEEGFVPAAKYITVYNVLSLKRVPEGVIIPSQNPEVSPQCSDVFSIDIDKSGNIANEGVQIVNEDIWKINSSGDILLKNRFDESVTLSVSIFHEDSLCSVHTSTLPEMANGWKNVKATVNKDYIPEYEGEIIRLDVSDNVPEGRLFSVSFPGKQPDYYFAAVNDNHQIVLYTKNVPGERDMVCEPYPLDTTLLWSAEIEDNFLRPVPSEIPVLSLRADKAKALARRGIAMQLAHRFQSDTLSTALTASNRVRLSNPEKTYILDDYTRFPLMREVIIEYVSEIMLHRNRNHEELKVTLEGAFHQSYTDDVNSIIFLDGMPVFDHNKFLSYSPLLVRQLDIFKRSFVEGTTFYSGAANFQTYKNDLSGWSFADNVRILRFHGVSYPTELTFSTFTSGHDVMDNPAADYRQTLYWKPLMPITASSEQNIKVATPCYTGHFTILVEGMTESGKTFSSSSSFDCK